MRVTDAGSYWEKRFLAEIQSIPNNFTVMSISSFESWKKSSNFNCHSSTLKMSTWVPQLLLLERGYQTIWVSDLTRQAVPMFLILCISTHSDNKVASVAKPASCFSVWWIILLHSAESMQHFHNLLLFKLSNTLLGFTQLIKINSDWALTFLSSRLCSQSTFEHLVRAQDQELGLSLAEE